MSAREADPEVGRELFEMLRSSREISVTCKDRVVTLSRGRRSWIFSMMYFIVVFTLTVYGVTKAAGAPDKSWNADDGFPLTQGWEILQESYCIPLLEELWEGVPFFEGEGLAAVYITNTSGHGHTIGDPQVTLSPEDDAVYEFVAWPLSGIWTFGLDDGQRSIALSLDTDPEYSFGFVDPDTIDVAPEWIIRAPFPEEFGSPGALNRWTMEKHGQDFVRVLLNGTEVLVADYQDLPNSSPQSADQGLLVKGSAAAPGYIYDSSYRHHVGSVDFPILSTFWMPYD